MGIIELMGVFLLFRRTVTLGAIISLMTTAHIMAINYFYDVPVKILSTALFLMCLFLLAQNLKPLAQFFLDGKAVKLKHAKAPSINNRWLLRYKTVLHLVFIAAALLISVNSMLHAEKRYGDGVTRLPLYGAYQVDSFISNRDSLEISTKGVRWQRLNIQRADYSSVQYTTYYTGYCNLNVDTVRKTIKIVFKDDVQTTHQLSYQMPDAEQLILSGDINGSLLPLK